jgi:anti-anti-sigma regulatory factor
MATSRPIVSLVGDLDYFNICSVREALAPIHGKTVIDLTRAQLLGAAVMTELVRVAKRAQPEQVVLVVSSPKIREVLRLVELDRLFRVVERIGDA